MVLSTVSPLCASCAVSDADELDAAAEELREAGFELRGALAAQPLDQLRRDRADEVLQVADIARQPRDEPGHLRRRSAA